MVQRIGSVYLNYYSTFLTIPSLHYLQLKDPFINSGFVSVVLVTVPWIDISYPKAPVFKSLILLIVGKLKRDI